MIIIEKNMCGGVGFKIKNISEEELKKIFINEEIDLFKKRGEAYSFYWDELPVLPVKIKKQIKLICWGNKNESIKFPKTGWAREESIKSGKWNYLNPEIVDVPINQGYEKKIWFDMPSGTKGILTHNSKGEQRVYMITKEADKEYVSETKHNREPLGKKINYRKEAIK